MIVVWLFLAVPRVCLQFVIVVFPDHTHLLSLSSLVDSCLHKFKRSFIHKNRMRWLKFISYNRCPTCFPTFEKLLMYGCDLHSFVFPNAKIFVRRQLIGDFSCNCLGSILILLINGIYENK